MVYDQEITENRYKQSCRYIKAHDFIPAKYWKNNFQLVKKYVMIWSQK